MALLHYYFSAISDVYPFRRGLRVELAAGQGVPCASHFCHFCHFCGTYNSCRFVGQDGLDGYRLAVGGGRQLERGAVVVAGLLAAALRRGDHLPARDGLALGGLGGDGQRAVGEELAVEGAGGEQDAVDGDAVGQLGRALVDGDGDGGAEVPLGAEVAEEVVGARGVGGGHAPPAALGVAGEPLLGFLEVAVDFVAAVTAPRGVLGAVGHELVHGLGLDEVDDGAGALGVHEVTHEDAALVQEQGQQLRVLQHVADESRGGFAEGPGAAGVRLGMVEEVDGVVVVGAAVEPESEVGVLDDGAPDLGQSRVLVVVVGAPEDEVVAGEVDVAVEEVGYHDVQVLVHVQPLLVFGPGVALLAVEGLEVVVEVAGAGLQLLDEVVDAVHLLVRNLHHVDVLQAVVVAVDVVVVGALADVEHAHVLAVDVDHGGVAGLPVEVGEVGGHGALDDGVAEVEVAEVVAAVAQRERLELGDAGLLVGEELVLELLVVGVEALVGVEGHRLQGVRARLAALDAELAELVEGAGLALRREELDVHRAAPVVVLLVGLAVVVGKESDGLVVQVAVVGGDGEDGQRHLALQEDIGLHRGARRQPAVAEQLGADGGGGPDADGPVVERAATRGLRAVGGIANLRALGSPLGQRQRQPHVARPQLGAAQRAEDGSAQQVLAVADLAAVGSARRRHELVAPLVAAVRPAAIGNVRSRHLSHLLQLVHHVAALEQVEVAVLARLQAEVGVQALLLLVAVDEDVAAGGNLHAGQLVGLLHLVLVADFVVLQVDGGIRRVVQFHPGVGKLLDVVHDALDVRLHQFVDFQSLCGCTATQNRGQEKR